MFAVLQTFEISTNKYKNINGVTECLNLNFFLIIYKFQIYYSHIYYYYAQKRLLQYLVITKTN